MRLLLCNACSDVLKLVITDDDRHCFCGRSYGRLDNVGTVFAGGPSVILGINDGSLDRAVRNVPDVGEGSRFYAFVMPLNAPKLVRENASDHSSAAV